MRCEAILSTAGIGHFDSIISHWICVSLLQHCACACDCVGILLIENSI